MRRTFSSLLSFVFIFSVTVSPVLAATDGFDKGATSAELRTAYDEGTIRILIAPGHEPAYGGAVYQGVYEREIVMEVARELERLLNQNGNYEVIVTRSGSSWNKTFDRYFDKEEDDIEDFVEDQKRITKRLERRGDIEEKDEPGVAHGAAPNDVALRLYGINKWANENDIDLILNLHVNDAPDHGPNEPSKHSGYAVYIPDGIFGNHKTSKELARDIAHRLNELSEVSTLPGESTGVVPDRELIAVGAYGTLNVPSVLIEYGYITEPRFTLPEHRSTVTKDAAYQTYLALQDFFRDPVANPRDVAKLPTEWPKPVVATSTATTTATTTQVAPATTTPATTTPAVLGAALDCSLFTTTLLPSGVNDAANPAIARLQKILAKDKTIYPEGLVTGYFGPATLRAVQALQKREGIVSTGTPETTGYGAVGPRTAKALQTLCSR